MTAFRLWLLSLFCFCGAQTIAAQTPAPQPPAAANDRSIHLDVSVHSGSGQPTRPRQQNAAARPHRDPRRGVCGAGKTGDRHCGRNRDEQHRTSPQTQSHPRTAVFRKVVPCPAVTMGPPPPALQSWAWVAGEMRRPARRLTRLPFISSYTFPSFLPQSCSSSIDNPAIRSRSVTPHPGSSQT